MYDTSKAKVQNLTLDEILTKTSEYDIYRKYLGDFKIGHIFQSPFRKDKNPSFGVYIGRKGDLLFKDHGTGECGNVAKFVGLYYKLNSYTDILAKIYHDLQLSNIVRKVPQKKYQPPSETVIGIVRQPFIDIDIDYWKQFGISTKTLKKFDVHSIKYYLCNGIVKGIYKYDNPMYAYKVYDHFKIYRPLGDKYTKWRSNLTSTDVQGYAQLPNKGNLLIITKSLKDVMVLHEMGYNAISPSSESTFIPDIVVEAISVRFKSVLILFDRDGPGMIQSRKISLKTRIPAFFVHRKFKAKDLSDAVKNTSLMEVKEWLQQTLKKYE